VLRKMVARRLNENEKDKTEIFSKGPNQVLDFWLCMPVLFANKERGGKDTIICLITH